MVERRSRWDRSAGRPEPVRALNRIREVENGEPLVDLRVVCPWVVIHRPQVIPYLRERVAQMLGKAAQSLPAGFQFGVIDAWRPFQRQERIYDYMTKCALEVHPHLTFTQLRRKVNRWVAPPHEKAPPGHCTGAAVDVYLLDEQGEPVNVSSPYTRFSAAPTYSYGLSPEAHANRMLLVNAMLGVGFSNCRDEWWHYSFGDAGWAVRMGLQECCYGRIDLEPDLYAENERLWIEAMKDRGNPFREF